MREIKFRVWDKTKSEWHNDENGYYADSEWIGVNELLRDKNYDFTQYTGLKDKNGKEIYEGDIIKSEKMEGEIVWSNHYAGWSVHGYLFDRDFNIPLEIIGNIYENPELKED